jgi:hypothetical protein
MVGTIRVFLFVVLIASVVGGAHARERRVALVIGNAAYVAAPWLPNALNDADDMSAALKVMGFEVIDGRDLNKEEMVRILARFAREIQGAEAAVFYYAGHGLQFLEQNYLLPVDAKVDDELGLWVEAIKLEDVISALGSNNGVRILVLDACRNNPFTERLAQSRGARGIGRDRGLARVERSQGMLIAYATQANQVAEDGDGRNSRFTAALVEEIKQPGLEVVTIFRHVQSRVNEATGGRQTPELSLSLLGEFYFKRETTDIEVWQTLNVDDPEQLKAFIARFPDSILSETARRQLQSDLHAREVEAEIRQVIDDIAALKRTDREHVSAAAPANPADLASPVAKPGAPETGRQKVEAEAENHLAALQDERRRIEADRPDRRSNTDAPTKPRRRLASCEDVLVRAQLGELTEDDVEALKRCPHGRSPRSLGRGGVGASSYGDHR